MTSDGDETEREDDGRGDAAVVVAARQDKTTNATDDDRSEM